MRTYRWARRLAWIGLAGLLLAVLDPMEGAFIALPFCAVLTVSAFLATSRYRVLLYWAFGSMFVGVGVLIVLTLIGGIGGSSGRSMWWGLLLVPYPLGWLMALFLGARVVREPMPSIREKAFA